MIKYVCFSKNLCYCFRMYLKLYCMYFHQCPWISKTGLLFPYREWHSFPMCFFFGGGVYISHQNWSVIFPVVKLSQDKFHNTSYLLPLNIMLIAELIFTFIISNAYLKQTPNSEQICFTFPNYNRSQLLSKSFTNWHHVEFVKYLNTWNYKWKQDFQSNRFFCINHNVLTIFSFIIVYQYT